MICGLKYLSAYYAFIAGIGVGIPIGTLCCAYAIRLLLGG